MPELNLNTPSTSSALAVGCDALLSSAMSLLGKLRIVHSSPKYKRVWEIAQAHLGVYDGLKYEDEMTKLEKAIEAQHEKIFPEEFDSITSDKAVEILEGMCWTLRARFTDPEAEIHEDYAGRG